MNSKLFSSVLQPPAYSASSTVGTGLKDWVPYREMSAAHPGKIDYTVGLHPCYVDAEWNDAVTQLSTFFMPPNAPVALGEIGLDYFHLPKDPVEAGEHMLHQEAAFRQQLSIASELEVPIIIHNSRNAFDDTFRMIDESGVDWSRSSSIVSATAPMKSPNSTNAAAAAPSPASSPTRMRPRSARHCAARASIASCWKPTAPTWSPEPHRGKPNEPAFVADIARRCAEALALSEGELAASATANTKTFFNLS